MKRPKIDDFNVEYMKGVAVNCSVMKQYSSAQDRYIDYLEQNLCPKCGCNHYGIDMENKQLFCVLCNTRFGEI